MLEIAEVMRISGFSSFCSQGDVGHFPGSDIVQMKSVPFRLPGLQIFQKASHGIAKKHVVIPGNTPMGMQFNENPGWAALNPNPLLHPEIEPFQVWRIGSGQIPVLNAR